MDSLIKNRDPRVPWWVHFAYVFGIPALMAIFMLWFITNRIDDALKDINKSLVKSIEETRGVRERLDKATYQNEIMIDQMDNITMQQQQTCVNTATDFTQRRACLQRIQKSVDKETGKIR